MNWAEHVKQIYKRRELASRQGGPEAIEKHHQRGKLTIRERIEGLLDPASFREHGQMAGAAELDDDDQISDFTPANYVVGVGKIDGRTIAVGGEDFTLKGGSPNASGLRKSVYAEHLAVQHRVPLVRLLEGGGGSVGGGGDDKRKARTVGDPVYAAPRFRIIAQAMGEIPIASAALGPVAGFPAGRLVASHFSVMTRDTAQVMIAGPALVERALGRTLSKEQLGGARIHAGSGVVDNIARDEPDAFAQIRRFLGYLPANVWERAPRAPCDDPVDRRADALSTIVPEDRREIFDMREVVRLVVDQDTWFEMAPAYGQSLRVGLARLNGQSVGIIANDCRHVAGAMTASAAQKMRRFVELCDTFHIPIVNFVDEPGFMIGLEAERAATIRYGMSAVMAAAQASVPWASVMVHKSFGVAAAAHYGPDAYLISWPSAETGALPVEGGVAVAFRRQIAAAENPDAVRRELEEKLAASRSPYPAAESFAVHELIDPCETRPMLCDWVDAIQTRLDTLTGPVSFPIRP